MRHDGSWFEVIVFSFAIRSILKPSSPAQLSPNPFHDLKDIVAPEWPSIVHFFPGIPVTVVTWFSSSLCVNLNPLILAGAASEQARLRQSPFCSLSQRWRLSLLSRGPLVPPKSLSSHVRIGGSSLRPPNPVQERSSSPALTWLRVRASLPIVA